MDEDRNGSIEISVQTDLTITSDNESDHGIATVKRHAKEVRGLQLEKSELQQLIEKLKLEVQSRDAQLSSLASKHEAALNAVVRQKDDILSKKQIQLHKAQAELLCTKGELKTLQERAARELASLTQKCSTFQENQKRLSYKNEEIRQSLENLRLTREEYAQLRKIPSYQLTLQQYTLLRVYDMVWPLQLQVEELKSNKSVLESSLESAKLECQHKEEQITKLHRELSLLQERNEEYAGQLIMFKEEQRTDEYKARNFERVRNEKEKCELLKKELEKKCSELELISATLKQEGAINKERLTEFRGKTRFQESKIEQLEDDLRELKIQSEKCKTDLCESSSHLRKERERNTELHEKYVEARGQLSLLQEKKQEQEYVITNMNDKLTSSKKTISKLQEELIDVQEKSRQKLLDAEEIKRRMEGSAEEQSVEVKEMTVRLQQLASSHANLVMEKKDLVQKLENTEQLLQNETHMRKNEVSHLKFDLEKTKKTLAEYQALEQEVEENIISEAENYAGSIGSFSRLGSPPYFLTNRRATGKCIQLTKKALMLERKNKEAYGTLVRLTDALKQMKMTLLSYRAALDMASQPTAQLLEKIANQEEMLLSLESSLEACSNVKDSLKKENHILSRKLLATQNELQQMAQNVSDLKTVQDRLSSLQNKIRSLQPNGQRVIRKRQTVQIPSSRPEFLGEQMEHQGLPKAIVITKGIERPN